MTLDLTQFHEIFFEESFEALDSMEAALLKLSAGEVDAELINTIFRVAHSIKGGAATFGFNEVAGFTHVLETLLDQLRAGKRQVRPGHRRRAAALGRRDARHARRHAAQGSRSTARASRRCAPRLDRIMGEAGSAAAAGSGCAPPRRRRQGRRRESAPRDRRGWRIQFVPGPELLRHGNDPLRILRELAHARQPAKCRSMPSGVPPLTDLDPEVCRLSLEPRGAGRRSNAPPSRRCSSGWKANASSTIERVGGEPAGAARSAAPVAVPAAAPAAARRCRASGRSRRRSLRTRSASPDGGSIRVSIEKIDELLNSVGELVITQSVLSQLAAPLEGREAEELRSALGAARAPHARAAGKRHARAHVAHQLRVQPLPAPGARPRPAPRQEDRAAASPATPPSSTRPCSRRSAIRWCTWCAIPSTTASRCPKCALAAGKSDARHHRACTPITRAAT